MKYKVTFKYKSDEKLKEAVREYKTSVEMRKKIKIFLDFYESGCYYWINEIKKTMR